MASKWIWAFVSLVCVRIAVVSPVANAQERFTGASFHTRAVELYHGVGGDPVSGVWRVDVSTADFGNNAVRMCRVFGQGCVWIEMRASNPGYAFHDGNSVCIDDPTPGVDVTWSIGFDEAWGVRGVNWTGIDAPYGAQIWTVAADFTTGYTDIDFFSFSWLTTMAGTMFAYNDHAIVGPILITERELCISDIYVIVQ